MNPLRTLEQPTVWLSTRRSAAGGRASRDYAVYDDTGAPVLVAVTSAWRRDIVVQTAQQPQQVFVLLHRRWLFPLTGQVDVFNARERRLGVVNRSGRYTAADGRHAGQFRDARTFGERAREGAIVGVLDALLAGEGTTSQLSGPTGFVWLVDSQLMGTLARSRLPFGSELEAAGASSTTRAARFARFAKRLREFAGPARPDGWKLERLQPTMPTDPRVILAAAIFAIELSHW
jgi:hypothetical protein